MMRTSPSRGHRLRSALRRPILALLPALAVLAGCGGGSSVLITVRDDQENRPVPGVVIWQVGEESRLGVTGSDGIAEIRPRRTDGETIIRLEAPAALAATITFESSYQITGDEFRNGKKFIRARVGQGEDETKARLRVSSEPAGASVFVNGNPAGMTDSELTGLPLGRAEIVLTLAGMHPDTVVRFLEPGENPEYHKQLTPQEVTTARLAVTSNPPGAAVTLNGRRTDLKTPAQFGDLAAGSYSVKVSLAGYEDFQTRVSLKKGQSGSVDAGNLQKPRTAAAGGGGRDQGAGRGQGSGRDQGADDRAGDTRDDRPAGSRFSKAYIISTAPGWAEVFVDGDPVNRNISGSFRFTLEEGPHDFRLINNQAGINTVVSYEVRRGDANQKLILNYETRKVVGRP